MGHHILGAEKRAPEIHLEHFVEIRRSHAEKQAVAVNPGVVYQDINAPESFNYRFDSLLGADLVGDVSRNQHGIASAGGDGVHHFGGSGDAGVVVQGHLGPRFGKPAGDNRAYAARRARNQGHLPFETYSGTNLRHRRPSPYPGLPKSGLRSCSLQRVPAALCSAVPR